ncbi:MAG: GDP-mannose 4,6-dehydratase [Ignavibacteria bacterium]|nr:GDP-mannose 4,6-dehydratase [Ignavibacteria bacterium]
MRKYILLTGGAGFIGSHLCETLLRNGHRVINIDNFNNQYNPDIKRSNIKNSLDLAVSVQYSSSWYQFIEGSIMDEVLLDRLFSSFNIDLVIHLAAYAGVRYSLENPEIYMDVNIKGTLNLLEKCRKYRISKFIFASSSSVYGNNKHIPFSEKDSTDYPVSPYAMTKKAGELLCHTFHKLYKLNVACLRFFTVIGPRQRPDLAIHKFTKLILEGSDIQIYGDGSSERDYTYVDDIVDGIIRAASWINEQYNCYEIFNLGNSHPVSLNKVIDTIESITGKKAQLELLPMQPGDVERTYADISKAETVLGYIPKTSFERGVQEFVKWFTSYNKK